MKASAIFEPRPARWGFRGDPYFWDYLKMKLSNVELPADPDVIEHFVRTEHYRLSGKPLTEDSMAYVEAFAHGGMSSGGLSGEFWTNEGIPLLRSRCLMLTGGSPEDESTKNPTSI